MPREYILLPGRSLKVLSTNWALKSLMVSVGHARSTHPAIDLRIPEGPTLKVIDSIHEDGPKLVVAEDRDALALRSIGLRLAPIIRYRLARQGRFEPKPPADAGTQPPVAVTVNEKGTSKPIEGATVTVFRDFARNEGAEAVTDSSGQCTLDLGSTTAAMDRVYVHPPLVGYWGAFQTSVACNGGLRVELEPLSATHVDARKHFYPTTNPHDGAGIRVGVVDSGIDNTHPDLAHVVAGRNTAKGEPAALWQDNGTGHGTHVAGVIGGRGGIHGGLAPECEMLSYRAFPQDSVETTNYQILKAIIRAIDDGCHLINLSLSGEDRADETIRGAIEDAHENGVLVIAAAGNAGRPQVGYPAFYAFQEGLSVSAMGRKGTFPTGSHEESNVGTVFGRPDSANFVAQFSNTGDVSLVGPGVGIISAVPGGYGVMSGTSMACPAATGMLAKLLSDDAYANGVSAVIAQPADANRTMAMIQMAARAAKQVFQKSDVEGDGLLQ